MVSAVLYMSRTTSFQWGSVLRIRNRKRTPPLPPLNVFVLTQCTMGKNKARGSFESAIFMFVVDVCLTISTIPSAAGNIKNEESCS